MVALEKLVQAAQEDGWAVSDGKLTPFTFQLGLLGWSAVPSRKGGSPVDVLKPVEAEAAPKQSLSATYGLDAQPLHTDGAHHPDPPDIVLLAIEAPSDVPTMLWRLPGSGIPLGTLHDMQHGIFTVRTGNDAFLATALTDGHLRFDPGCMTPSDSRARRAFSYLTNLKDGVVEHAWIKLDQILAVDNRRVLHARGSATDEPDRTMHRLAIRLAKEGS